MILIHGEAVRSEAERGCREEGEQVQGFIGADGGGKEVVYVVAWLWICMQIRGLTARLCRWYGLNHPLTYLREEHIHIV